MPVTQILLKDQDVYDYQNQMCTRALGYVQAYSDIVNQKRVLTSYDLIDRTLDKLDFDISYYHRWSFQDIRRSTAHCLSWSIWTCWTIA